MANYIYFIVKWQDKKNNNTKASHAGQDEDDDDDKRMGRGAFECTL